MAPSQRESPVFQLVRANHEQAEAGHKRLREDWREHEDRLDTLEEKQSELAMKVQGLASMPQDLSKLTLSSGMVAGLVLSVAAIVGGVYGVTWGIRSDVRDISTRMESQVRHDQDSQRLLEERFRVMGVQIDGIVKKQELNQLEIQNLRETILGRRTAR